MILETGMRVRELIGRMGFKLGHTLKGLFKVKQVIWKMDDAIIFLEMQEKDKYSVTHGLEKCHTS